MSRPATSLIGGIALACALMIGLEAQTAGTSGNVEARKLKNPVQATPQSVTAGKDLYAKNCRSCHGADAKGDGPMKPKDSHPSDLTDKVWSRGGTDGEIYAVLRDGAGPDFVMRGYKSRFTDQDLWNLVNYLRSLGPKAAH
jgi:mono/diheme cytochrome c family protein